MQEHDAAPIRTKTQTVESAWIDYNGHMNVAYYTLAFDRALDDVYELMDIGPSAVKSRGQGPMALQTQIHYLAELLEGEAFFCDALLLDCDHKRCHAMLTMIAAEDGRIAATYETLSINVDLSARRSAAYPEAVGAALVRLRDAQSGLARPAQMGRQIGIRR
ncbi:MAG: thioesterase family protein [Pseudomonadota bacterium]